MKFCLLVLFLTVFVASFGATPDTSPATKKKAVPKKTAPPRVAAPKSAGSSSAKPAGKSTSRPVAKKRGKSSGRAVAPRQLTPTPERYKEIQQALANKGYLKSEPNGVWDGDSMEALRQFQTDQKQAPTGKITASSLIGLGLGPKTLASPVTASAPPAVDPPKP